MLEKRPFRALLVLFYFRSTFDKCCKTKRFCLQGISAETKVSTKQKTATSGSQDNFFSFPTALHCTVRQKGGLTWKSRFAKTFPIFFEQKLYGTSLETIWHHFFQNRPFQNSANWQFWRFLAIFGGYF